ncbi:MAG: hypothetical protein ABIO70_00060 [Pseudomonadota bacterium]
MNPAPVLEVEEYRKAQGPGLALSLLLDVDTPQPPPHFIDQVSQALAAVRGLVQPLYLQASFDWVDEGRWMGLPGKRDGHEAIRALRAARLPEGVVLHPAFPEVSQEHAEELTYERVAHWLSRGLTTTERRPGRVLTWSWLRTCAVRARLPAQAGPLLRLRPYRRDPCWLPVQVREGAPWVSGPTESTNPSAPLSLALHRESYRLDLGIHLHWDLWEPHETLLDELRLAVAFLVSVGWEVDADPFGMGLGSSGVGHGR